MSEQKKTPRYKITTEQISNALEATGGFITLAAKQIGCSHKTIQRRLKSSAKLQQHLDDICETKLDVAEAALMKAVREGKAWAVCFYLKCKGKHRGYVERQEITGRDGGPIISSEADLSDVELDTIIGFAGAHK